MNEQKKLMRALQNYGFILTETALYLDTHPYCRQALRYYEKYRRLHEETKKLYEEKYGPLSCFGNLCGESWKWVTEPWPWEIC